MLLTEKVKKTIMKLKNVAKRFLILLLIVSGAGCARKPIVLNDFCKIIDGPPAYSDQVLAIMSANNLYRNYLIKVYWDKKCDV